MLFLKEEIKTLNMTAQKYNDFGYVTKGLGVLAKSKE
jgi:hypothetical protein